MLPNYAYFKGKIVPYSEAKVGVATHALNYGTGAFGGMRGYWNDQEEELFIFRPMDHYKRLLNSAKLLSMELDITAEDLLDRLRPALDRLVSTGIARERLDRQSMVTPSCGMGSMTVPASEHVVRLTAELSRLLRG